MNAQLTRADVFAAVLQAEEKGIETPLLCQRFANVEPQRVHSLISKLVKESPPRIVRTAPGRVVAACYHSSQQGRIQTAPVRRLGIVVGSQDHQILLALRAPGGMTSDQFNARFPNSPSTALSRLRADGLVEVGDFAGLRSKALKLTEKGRALVDPDGPLARRRTLNTYCQL